MYEEGIDGQFYFYTNIGNGQITDQSVYIDFPSNLTYTAELDGETITYISKQPMVQKGTYVFRITAVYQSGSLYPSRQNIRPPSASVFRISRHRSRQMKPRVLHKTAVPAMCGTVTTAALLFR